MLDSLRPLDRNRVEAHYAAMIERARHRGLRHNIVFFFLYLGISLVVFFLVPILSGDGMAELGSISEVLRFLRAPLLTAGALTIWSAITWRRMRGRNVAVLADRAMHEYSRLSGPGWLRGALGMGLRMFLLIGVPLGALLAVFFPASAAERATIFLAFLGMTALWTFPFGFVIRWMTLRTYRQFARSD